MTTVNVQVATASQLFPASTVAGKLRISVNGQPDQDVDGNSAVFELVAGDYTTTAQRLDSAGNALGAQVSQTFAVPADVGVDIPTSITVTV